MKKSHDDEPLASDDPELQNTRRLVVDVEEGRTVMFLSLDLTLEKAMMFAEFRQGNFDLLGGVVHIDYKDGHLFKA